MKKTIALLLALSLNIWALTVGEHAPSITIDGENGGTANEKPWSSQESLQGKVHVLFYVDPDENLHCFKT